MYIHTYDPTREHIHECTNYFHSGTDTRSLAHVHSSTHSCHGTCALGRYTAAKKQRKKQRKAERAGGGGGGGNNNPFAVEANEEKQAKKGPMRSKSVTHNPTNPFGDVPGAVDDDNVAPARSSSDAPSLSAVRSAPEVRSHGMLDDSIGARPASGGGGAGPAMAPPAMRLDRSATLQPARAAPRAVSGDMMRGASVSSARKASPTPLRRHTTPPTREGFLVKQSGGRSKFESIAGVHWDKRWFELSDTG